MKGTENGRKKLRKNINRKRNEKYVKRSEIRKYSEKPNSGRPSVRREVSEGRRRAVSPRIRRKEAWHSQFGLRRGPGRRLIYGAGGGQAWRRGERQTDTQTEEPHQRQKYRQKPREREREKES